MNPKQPHLEKKKKKSWQKLPLHPTWEDLIQILCLPDLHVYCCYKHQINQLYKKKKNKNKTQN